MAQNIAAIDHGAGRHREDGESAPLTPAAVAAGERHEPSARTAAGKWPKTGVTAPTATVHAGGARRGPGLWKRERCAAPRALIKCDGEIKINTRACSARPIFSRRLALGCPWKDEGGPCQERAC
ncbi:hypothetical protein HPB48_017991 [Haemaphysalis longicornis]|uniref:Uncharacterized protein n=1 Tax=Haemaphysalis longicornis TaxID=44386 RepID=A0A9J6FHD9_HAELO|nr:hypothetical protein HPB48_017991 [Haemaphysalis longicornis]